MSDEPEVEIRVSGGPRDGETVRVPLIDGKPPSNPGNVMTSGVTGEVLAYSRYQLQRVPEEPSGWLYVFVEELPGSGPLQE